MRAASTWTPWIRLMATVAFSAAAITQVTADESASGLYVPGSFGFDAGKTPEPGLYGSAGVFAYDGRIHLYIDGGTTALDVRKQPFLASFATLYVPDFEGN